MAEIKQKPKTRNPLHDHPLLRKSAVHEKTNKAKRKREKQNFKNQLKQEWRYLIASIAMLLSNAI